MLSAYWLQNNKLFQPALTNTHSLFIALLMDHAELICKIALQSAIVHLKDQLNVQQTILVENLL